MSHVKLLFKVEYLGVKCSLFWWFRSYLTPSRRHRTVIDNESSDFLLVKSEVPQKSILGPFLFSIFINDMPKLIWRETSLPLFADDAKCFRLIFGQDDCDKLLYGLNDLLLLGEWSSMLKIVKVLRVARVRSAADRDYFLGGIKLDRVSFEKDLWILLSYDLSWNKLVDFISSKAQKMLNLLYRTCKEITDVRTKKLLHITWVRSRLEYPSVVWSLHTKRNNTNLRQV